MDTKIKKNLLAFDEEGGYIGECSRCLWKLLQRGEEDAEEIQRRVGEATPQNGAWCPPPPSTVVAWTLDLTQD